MKGIRATDITKEIDFKEAGPSYNEKSVSRANQ